MPDEKTHLKIIKEFLGWEPNIIINKLLNGANWPQKIRLIYHRTTHNPDFIDKNITEPEFTEKDNLEAWCHYFVDLGLIPYSIQKKLTKSDSVKKIKIKSKRKNSSSLF
jgi:hypothetical protein